LFSNDNDKARALLLEFLTESADDATPYVDNRVSTKITEAAASETIKRIGKIASPLGVLDMEKDERKRVLALLRAEGISVRQLSRLTGVTRGIIQRVR
jgi:hypothetical protein